MADTGSGYSIYEHLFEALEMREVLQALERTPLTRSKAGARHVQGAGEIAPVQCVASREALSRCGR